MSIKIGNFSGRKTNEKRSKTYKEKNSEKASLGLLHREGWKLDELSAECFFAWRNLSLFGIFSHLHASMRDYNSSEQSFE